MWEKRIIIWLSLVIFFEIHFQSCIPSSIFNFLGIDTLSSAKSTSSGLCRSEFGQYGTCVGTASFESYLESTAQLVSSDFTTKASKMNQSLFLFMKNITIVCNKIIQYPYDFYSSPSDPVTPYMIDGCNQLLSYPSKILGIYAGFASEINSGICLKYYLQIMAGAFCKMGSGNGSSNFYIAYSSFYLGVNPKIAKTACIKCGYAFIVFCILTVFNQVITAQQKSNFDPQIYAACQQMGNLYDYLQNGASLNSETASGMFQAFFYLNGMNLGSIDIQQSVSGLIGLNATVSRRRLVSATFGFKFVVLANGTDVWTSGVNSGTSFVGWEKLEKWRAILLILILTFF